MSKNVACPKLEAERTVVHVALSVDRTMVTDTSGFDHVTKIDRQSSAMAETPSVVVVVLMLVQPPAGQASQTLEDELRYECPPLGGCARQARALRLIAHVVVPLGVVRQHVTWSGLPHTERCAQLMTAALQRRDKAPETTASCATRETHDI
jgi:hypothetical protein